MLLGFASASKTTIAQQNQGNNLLIEHVNIEKEQAFKKKNGADYYDQPGCFNIKDDGAFAVNKLDLPDNTLFYIENVSESSSVDGARYFYAKLVILGQVATDKELSAATISVDDVTEGEETVHVIQQQYTVNSEGVRINVKGLGEEIGRFRVLSSEVNTFASYGYVKSPNSNLRKGTPQALPLQFNCIVPKPFKKMFSEGSISRESIPDIYFYVLPHIDRSDQNYMDEDFITVTRAFTQNKLEGDPSVLLTTDVQSSEYKKMQAEVIDELKYIVTRNNSLLQNRLISSRYKPTHVNRKAAKPYFRSTAKF